MAHTCSISWGYNVHKATGGNDFSITSGTLFVGGHDWNIRFLPDTNGPGKGRRGRGAARQRRPWRVHVAVFARVEAAAVVACTRVEAVPLGYTGLAA
jgi:hypothetical protein